jgi:trimethylamine--corrinoid protein Co-methyltransferase
MESDYFYPAHADREQPRTWAESGAKDAWQVANDRVREVLANHNPDYLTPEQQGEIKALFNILLG